MSQNALWFGPNYRQLSPFILPIPGGQGRRRVLPSQFLPSRFLQGVGLFALLTCGSAGAAQAQIAKVEEGDFHADAGLITFSEYPQGTVDPVYIPETYGGGANAPTVSFGGYFSGQGLSQTPDIDCPGAAATACVVSNPSAPLSLDPSAPSTFITTDGSNPTSPVLSGSPTFNGPIAVLFSKDQAGVGFDGGYFNAVGSTGITAFDRSGNLLGTVVNTTIGIEFLGVVNANGNADIAGVFLDMVGAEPAGFAIDNLRFGLADQINIPNPPPGTAYTYWDGDAEGSAANGTVDGGNGVWSATRTNWTLQDGSANGAYAPNPTLAVFSGSPGTVTVDAEDGPVGVTGMQFSTSGYVITGDELHLAAPTAMVSVGNLLAETSGYVAEIDSALVGDGGLMKLGLGTLILGGDSTFTGATTVSVGTLRVDGSLSNSAVTVQSGAVLGGYGSVGSLVAESGATIAPGASIGTLGVTGNFSQAAGAIYAVELNSTGSADKLQVGGSATLASGAQLVVTKLDSARYVLGQRYTVLTAADGLTGTYTVSGDTSVSLFYKLVPTYTADAVYLDVAQVRTFASAASTANQIAAATGADSTLTGTLHDAIGYLQTEAEARTAFDAISGEIHASVRSAAFEDSRFVREGVFGHLSEATGGRAFWLHGYGSWGHLDGDGNAARWSRDIGGAVGGVDLFAGRWGKLGIMGGYAHSTLSLPGRSSSAKADDAHVGFYAGLGRGSVERGGLAVRLGAAYTARKVKTSRSVAFTDFSDSLSADYTLRVTQVFGEAAYRIPFGAISLEPFGNIAVVRVANSLAQEQGGAAAVTVHDRGTDVLSTQLGSRLTVGNGPLRLSGSLAWRHASVDSGSTQALLSFTNGDLFAISAPALPSDGLAYDLGAELRLGKGARLTAAYSGQSGQGLIDHGFKAALSIAF